MKDHKCPQCGLIGFPNDSICRRCGTELDGPGAAAQGEVRSRGPITAIVRTVEVCSAICLFLLIVYISFILTSDPLTFEQTQVVERAIHMLDERGFHKDAKLFHRFVSFRSTDNWWNRWMGHAPAYAAANFPFEVLTLYPDFFKRTTDDVERAAILLHESYHLLGHGEAAAHREVWLLKQALGWTQDKYSRTRVWKNTREATALFAPELFNCGPDGRSDCVR